MNDNHPVLCMNSDGFRVLVLSSLMADMNTCDSICGALTALLDHTTPDLVFLNGDITRALPTKELLRITLETILAPVVERGIPWAHTFGDMDRINGLPNEEGMDVYRSIPGCLSEAGPETVDGCGNYILPIYNKEGEPVLCLYALDSHSGVHEYQTDYGSPTRARLSNPLYGKHYLDGIRFNQSMFYWRTSIELERRYGRKIPGILLFHTPIPEITYLPMNPFQTKVQGIQRETVRCQVVAGGLFTAAVERGDIRAIVAGHSEHNNFYGVYGRIQLGQIRDFTLRDGSFTGGMLLVIDGEGNAAVSHANL